jgi:crotonobetainyl-CoA:carnitine CoA-transferase CaiB-like acyl-CoA transferase
MQAFQRLTVLDMSQGIAGPVSAGILARQGARVIKVEPLGGDWIRGTGASQQGMSANALAGNFNKRGVAIDAASALGREALLRMISQVDVLVENFRHGVMKKLGLDYEALSELNPRLVYCSITGFGTQGPLKSKPATDSVVQAYSGMAVVNGDAERPRRMGLYVPDNISALYAAQAISAALYERTETGRGQHVEISLVECCAAFQSGPMVNAYLFDRNPSEKVAVFAPAGEFRTKTGWMVVACSNADMFIRLAKAVGRDNWLSDPRYADSDVRKRYLKEINADLGEALAQDTREAWMQKLEAADVLVSPVHDYFDLYDDAQMQAMNYFCSVPQAPYGEVKVPHLPGASRDVKPAPRLGEHTQVVLQEMGFSEAEIDHMIQQRAAYQGKTSA